jgi:dihydrofolate reductase
MRYLMMFNRVSADGYFAGPEGNLDWAVPDDELDQGAVNALPQGDTILFGRRTYDNFERFWPNALRDPETAPDPHMPRRMSPAMRAMAVWINDATKVVFSRTRKEVTW